MKAVDEINEIENDQTLTQDTSEAFQRGMVGEHTIVQAEDSLPLHVSVANFAGTLPMAD